MSQAWRPKVRGATQEELSEAIRVHGLAHFLGNPVPDDLKWEPYVPWDPMPWVFGLFALAFAAVFVCIAIAAFTSL